MGFRADLLAHLTHTCRFFMPVLHERQVVQQSLSTAM